MKILLKTRKKFWENVDKRKIFWYYIFTRVYKMGADTQTLIFADTYKVSANKYIPKRIQQSNRVNEEKESWGINGRKVFDIT